MMAFQDVLEEMRRDVVLCQTWDDVVLGRMLVEDIDHGDD